MEDVLRSSFGLIAASLLASACASTGAVPRPFPMPGGVRPPISSPPISEPPTTSVPSTAVQPGHDAFDSYALVGTALSLRGVQYRNGGADPTGFDCSGFTQYVFAQYGVGLPREVRDQFESGKPVSADDMQPGDLVFFTTTGPGPTHVGIAIGSDQFVHAPSSTGVVRVERVGTAYWSSRFLGVRRVG
jgi:cell wall-associated NlpC family hydrolase